MNDNVPTKFRVEFQHVTVDFAAANALLREHIDPKRSREAGKAVYHEMPVRKTYRVDGALIPYTHLDFRATECQIIDLEKEEVVAVGAAVCSPDDNFEKLHGRKLAYARALEQFQLTEFDDRWMWVLFWGLPGGNVGLASTIAGHITRDDRRARRVAAKAGA